MTGCLYCGGEEWVRMLLKQGYGIFGCRLAEKGHPGGSLLPGACVGEEPHFVCREALPDAQGDRHGRHKLVGCSEGL